MRGGVAFYFATCNSSMCIDLARELDESENDFIDFYRETCNLEAPDSQRADLPRLINSCIDNTDYYTVDKWISLIHL